MRRIDGLTRWDMALIERVRRGGTLAAEDCRRFASEVEDLDAWRTLEDDDEFLDDLPPFRCDGSVCCPCGGCDGWDEAPAGRHADARRVSSDDAAEPHGMATLSDPADTLEPLRSTPPEPSPGSP
jgi:hypothetical protein